MAFKFVLAKINNNYIYGNYVRHNVIICGAKNYFQQNQLPFSNPTLLA